MAVRSSPEAPFGPPVNLPSPPNGGSDQICPWFWTAPDGNRFLIYSGATMPQMLRTGGFGADPGTRASFTISGAAEVGAELLLDASASTPEVGIISYAWSLGDGNRAEGIGVAHGYADAGRYQVTLVVTTGEGSCDYHSELITILEPSPPRLVFVRGDSNDDGHVDISDAVCVLNWLFLGAPESGCVAATNTNGDETADISDAVYLLGHLFLGGAAPVPPFPDCGPGTLPADEATCDTPPGSCQ
jgi:hypothetical protein